MLGPDPFKSISGGKLYFHYQHSGLGPKPRSEIRCERGGITQRTQGTKHCEHPVKHPRSASLEHSPCRSLPQRIFSVAQPPRSTLTCHLCGRLVGLESGVSPDTEYVGLAPPYFIPVDTRLVSRNHEKRTQGPQKPRSFPRPLRKGNHPSLSSTLSPPLSRAAAQGSPLGRIVGLSRVRHRVPSVGAPPPAHCVLRRVDHT